MKTKKVITALLSVVLAASTAVSVSAAKQLDNTSNTGNTDVTAQIQGNDEPGNVSYIITIPDKVDFGTLTQPTDNNTDHFVETGFTVNATQINGLAADGKWYVRVKVRDSNFVLEEEERFFISQKKASYDSSTGKNKFEYGVYIGDSASDIGNNRKDTNGINIAFFNTTGQKVDCKLRLNQNQLYGKELKEIAGEYSGSMIFHSSVIHAESTGN